MAGPLRKSWCVGFTLVVLGGAASLAFGQGRIRAEAYSGEPFGVGRVEVTIDGCGDEQLAEGTTGWRFGWDTMQLRDGEHKIAVRAYDLAGNASERVPPLVITVANGGDQSARRPFG